MRQGLRNDLMTGKAGCLQERAPEQTRLRAGLTPEKPACREEKPWVEPKGIRVNLSRGTEAIASTRDAPLAAEFAGTAGRSPPRPQAAGR